MARTTMYFHVRKAEAPRVKQIGLFAPTFLGQYFYFYFLRCLIYSINVEIFFQTFKYLEFFDIVLARVLFDRVRKRKNYFEIPAFLQIEQGKSRAGNSKSNENKYKTVFVFI